MVKAIVIINEQHKLLPQQEILLRERFGSYELLLVPARGWTREEVDRVYLELVRAPVRVVFVSPVPLLLARLSRAVGAGGSGAFGVFLFWNDRRVKQELDDGRIISRLDPEGWELVEV